MGGAIFTLEGSSRKEVSRKLKEKLREALAMGLHNERSVVQKDRATGRWMAYIAVHS